MYGIYPQKWQFFAISVKMTLKYRVNEDKITQLYPLASENDSVGCVLDNYDD